MALADPRAARAFRFVRHDFVRRDCGDGVAELVYAFDDGVELIERITFADAPAIVPARRAAFDAALDLLHLVAGVSYYKAGVPAEIRVETQALDAATAAFLDALYVNGLAEFAYNNKLDLHSRIHFPASAEAAHVVTSESNGIAAAAAPASTPPPVRTLVPIGGGKDSLVSVEILKRAGADACAIWVGHSPLIAACAERTGLPMRNVQRELSPHLFAFNKAGAWNGHIPVTAINSAILSLAAILYGYDAIAFSNERSASSATLEYEGQLVNHQWSKSWRFETGWSSLLRAKVDQDLDYFSLLRPLSELAVAERFARETRYDDVFSSCNRNFRILGPKPADRWCGQCPKCHFVFLALAPFMPKPRLLAIFGRNLLDDITLAPAFDALMEYRDHKPFECVGEGIESRAAMQALGARAEWREDALVARFADEIAAQLDADALDLKNLLEAEGDHRIPPRLQPFVFDADR